MGTNYYAVSKRPTVFSPIHIGKSSMGWKFLFHRVSCWENWVDDSDINTYPQWIEFLKKNEDKVLIMNEYDEEVSLKDFVAMVELKQREENSYNFTYADNIDGYRFTDGEFS